MERYHHSKDQLLGITRAVSSLCDEIKSTPGIGEAPTGHWKHACEEIREQITAELIRVAVIGPIKSGKSTFVNALFRGDYLRRGAGVVTSIVTRIRRGAALKATLFFKPWERINRDIEDAMVLFPDAAWRAADGPLDIRNDKDRSDLTRAMGALSEDLLITQDSRNMNSVIISAYLDGYDRVREIVSEDPVVREYAGDDFEAHQAYVGDDSLAVYLSDIELTIDAGDMDETIEIADCQGSDSPNPLHLAMIQDYLRMTHLIVYVISSRTGLRQADIKFLSTIKRMGILGNTLFLVNVDFGEHGTMDDLVRVTRKIREDVALLRPDPEVYILSSLFNLFRSDASSLTEKDRLRLAQWQAGTDMTAFSDAETGRFESDIQHKLTEERYALLLNNHLERLGVQAAGMAHWARVSRDIFGKDAREVAGIVREIGEYQKKILRMKSTIRSTLDGAVNKLKQTLKRDVDRFFDKHDGILGEALRFLKSYHPVYGEWEHHLKTAGFSSAMYLVFQDVKRNLDGFMAESVNPEIIRFIGEEEGRIRDHFSAIAGSYDAMVGDALVEYNQVMEGLGLSPLGKGPEPIALPETAAIIRSAGLKVPPAVASMQYSAGIRGEAVMRLGVYRVIRFFRQLFRKAPDSGTGEALQALKGGVLRLKRETEQSIAFNFKDYRENIKFQYLLSLADAVADAFYDALMERFDAHVSDLAGIATHIDAQTADTADIQKTLARIESACGRILEDIARLRTEISTAAEPAVDVTAVSAETRGKSS